MKHKTRTKALSWLLSLAMLFSVVPGMSLTAYATPTETLLTTITATAKEQANYSTANAATVSFSYTAGGSSAYTAIWGWWGYGFIATVTPADGYTITKCVFYDDADRTATDSEAPFVVETTEEDKTPQVNGTPILAYTSKGIKKIEVYGYATPAHTHSFTYSADGATITAECGAADCGLTDKKATLTISASNATYDGSTHGATLDSTAWTAAGLTAPTIKYAGRGNTSYAESETAPTNAGTYTASVTVDANKTAKVDFTISKATPTATAPTGLTATYGQTLGDVSLTAGWAWKDTATTSVGAVGSQTFAAVYTKDASGNYNTVEQTLTVTVTPKSITGAAVTLSATQLEYTGAEQSVSVTGVKLGGVALTTSDYNVSGNLSGTEKNTYTVTVTGKGNYTGSATATWAITDKPMTVSAPNVTATYDGQAHGITVTVNAPASGATIKYGNAVGTYDLNTSPTITNVSASPKTVYFKVTADNYADYTGSATITINKANVTGTPTYTAITASGKTLLNAELGKGTLAPGDGTLSWNDDNSTTVEQGKAYGWTYTPTDSANYSVKTGSITLWPAPTRSSSSSSDSSDRDTTPSTPSTPSTTTETKTSETATAADGAAVTTELDASTTTKTNSDGSVTVTDKATETVKTENADGSAVETKTEKTNAETTGSKKNADGSVTDTTKISNTETVTQTATDSSGSQTVTETKTEQEHSTAVTTKDNADGSKSEKTETTETVKVTEKVTDGSGKVTETVTTTKTETVTDMTAAQDGTATGTSTTTTTVTDDKGKVLSTTVTEAEIKASTDAEGVVTTETTATVTKTDADGNVTTEQTVTTEAKAPDGSTGTIVKDESGKVLSQETTISQQEAEKARDEGRPAQSPLTVTPVPEAVENSARSVQVNMPAVLYDKDGDGIVTVAEMPKVEIQVTYSGPGVVAKEKDASGNLTRITECYEGSVIVPVTGTGEIVIVDNTRTFNDVAGSDWYSEYVTFVTAREIFNGTGNGNFAPNETMNRAMLAQVLYNFARGAKAGDGTVFSDVKAGDWFNAAVGWAYENGIVNGYGGSFGAQNNITRQDMATILYRYAKQAGYDVSKTASLDKFSDAGSVADYAAEAMRWAVGMGLIEGSDGKLNPTGNATRAQVAAIMTRFVRNAK